MRSYLVAFVTVGLAALACEREPAKGGAIASDDPTQPTPPSGGGASSSSGSSASSSGGAAAASDAALPVTSGSSSGAAPGPARRPSGPPVESQPPNATGQTPAFPGQTRAPGDPAGVAFTVRVVASGLQIPWAVALLPDGAKVVTERVGAMRVIGADGSVSAPLGGVPAVLASGQGGLLDVVADPAFADSGLVFFTYAEAREDGSGTAVARGRLVREGAPRLEDVRVIWRMTPAREATFHYGARIVFGRDGNLFVAIGEHGASTGAGNARDVSSTNGKVIRIRPDGTAPPDNPLVGRPGALPEIFSLGLRNPQSAALNPATGELWTVEHGPRGGDEVNIIRAGKDYGWPHVSYGIDYSGAPLGDGKTSAPDVEQPVYFWDPVIAPSGAAFYDGDAFPAWKGSLLVGALSGRHLARLTLDGDRVIGEERLLVERGSRIRDVRVGKTGTIFVCDESKGEVLELVP
jgi:glucose/arabinose dehydrogenase